jgi:hypothetical protein
MAKRTKRREWTKDDVRELKTLARQKTPVAKIAKSLKRTPGATQQKASVCPWIHADSLAFIHSRMTCSVLAAAACPLLCFGP